MKILYIINNSCQNPSCGSEQRTYLLHKALQQIGDVYVIQIAYEVRKIDDLYWKMPVEELTGIKRVVNSIWSRIFNLICKELVFSYLPFAKHINIKHIYPNVKFDVVVVRYMNIIGLSHCWKYGSLYVDVDDYPMQVFETVIAKRIDKVRRYFARIVQKFFVWLCLRKVTGAWIANPEQINQISCIRKSSVLKNLPIIAPNYDYSPTDGMEGYIFTVGVMNYEPNYRGVDSFLTNIWPQVRVKFQKLEYIIVGKGIPTELKVKWSDIAGVRMLGFVDDLEPLYTNCLATVVPIDGGGGTCIKTLESLAHGRICFSTMFGARGLLSETIKIKDLGLFIYGTANEFITILDKIMYDSFFRNTCEKRNIDYIKDNYSFDVFKSSVLEVLL